MGAWRESGGGCAWVAVGGGKGSVPQMLAAMLRRRCWWRRVMRGAVVSWTGRVGKVGVVGEKSAARFRPVGVDMVVVLWKRRFFVFS